MSRHRAAFRPAERDLSRSIQPEPSLIAAIPRMLHHTSGAAWGRTSRRPCAAACPACTRRGRERNAGLICLGLTELPRR